MINFVYHWPNLYIIIWQQIKTKLSNKTNVKIKTLKIIIVSDHNFRALCLNYITINYIPLNVIKLFKKEKKIRK